MSADAVAEVIVDVAAEVAAKKSPRKPAEASPDQISSLAHRVLEQAIKVYHVFCQGKHQDAVRALRAQASNEERKERRDAQVAAKRNAQLAKLVEKSQKKQRKSGEKKDSSEKKPLSMYNKFVRKFAENNKGLSNAERMQKAAEAWKPYQEARAKLVADKDHPSDEEKAALAAFDAELSAKLGLDN